MSMLRIAIAIAGLASEVGAIWLVRLVAHMYRFAVENAAHLAREGGSILPTDEAARLVLADSTAPFWAGTALVLATAGGALFVYAALLLPDGQRAAERSASKAANA